LGLWLLRTATAAAAAAAAASGKEDCRACHGCQNEGKAGGGIFRAIFKHCSKIAVVTVEFSL
jgi:hypothetical protein